MTVLKLHIGAMYLYHLAHNGHSANVNWMNELITLTLNGDLCDLWQVIHHLDPSTLPVIVLLLLQQEFLQGSVLQRQSCSSTDVCHYHGRGPRTSLDAIPLRWRKRRRKTSKRSSLSLSQRFFICFLSSFLLPSHTHRQTPPHAHTYPSALLHPERHTRTSKDHFRAGIQCLLLSEIHFALATWQSLQITQWVFL